jgi:hypothetical protein
VNLEPTALQLGPKCDPLDLFEFARQTRLASPPNTRRARRSVADAVCQRLYGRPLIDDEWERIDTLICKQTGFVHSDYDPELEDWESIDLAPALRGDIAHPEPTILQPEGSGIALFYEGQINGLHGDSGTGKSLVALVAAAQEMTLQHPVIWIDFEDPNEATIVGRLRSLGVPDDDIIFLFHYIHPDTAASPSAVDRVFDLVGDIDARLLVLDSIGEAFALEGLDENKDVEVGPWIRAVLRPLAESGAAVVVIDHATKANDNPLHPSGSKRKRAAITGASYLVTAPKPLDREHGGRLTLTCAKDRHGNFARNAKAASIEFTVYPDDGMTWHVWPPHAGDEDDADDLSSRLVARAATIAAKRYLDRTGKAPSTRTLVAEMKGLCKGSTDAKRAGVELAVDSGALRMERDGQAHRYFFVRDFELRGGRDDDRA